MSRLTYRADDGQMATLEPPLGRVIPEVIYIPRNGVGPNVPFRLVDDDMSSAGVVSVPASSSVPDEYRVIVVPSKLPSQLEETLNSLAREGYEFLTNSGNYILMVRRTVEGP